MMIIIMKLIATDAPFWGNENYNASRNDKNVTSDLFGIGKGLNA